MLTRELQGIIPIMFYMQSDDVGGQGSEAVSTNSATKKKNERSKKRWKQTALEGLETVNIRNWKDAAKDKRV